MYDRVFALILLSTLSLWMFSCRKSAENRSWQLQSPDGKVSVDISQDSVGGRLKYEVRLVANDDTIQVLSSSPLGLICEDDRFDKLTFISADTFQVDETYTLTSGKRLENHNRAHGLTLEFESVNKAVVAIEFRAYNDGIAFRYTFPEAGTHTVTRETTGFRLAKNGKAWLQPYDTVGMYTPAYEKYYTDGTPLNTSSPNPSGWCFPGLFRIDGAWVMLTESNVTGDYFGAHLQNENESYVIQQPDPAEDYGMGSVNAKLDGPANTPWRIVIAGTDLADVVESNLVYHVANEKVDVDFSWVKPGRVSWGWWSDQASPRNFSSLKKFVDLAAEMGWEYSLVDANWNEMQGGNLEQLAKYAQQKGVGLWAWYNSGGPHNKVTEQPRDIMNDPVKRKEEMKKLQAWGIKGIKVDFFQSDKSFIMQQYLDILKDAAEYRIMVNFHGCTIPRGWSRTWPNLLSMESIRGAESYIFAPEFPEHAPLHNVHAAYTRNVVGPMDYTPVTFSNNTYPHITTNGHELALGVVFETGVLHLADAPESYRSLPAAIKTFLKNIPVTWDETKFLSGSPSSEIMIARRKGDDWYVGFINGENTTKNVDVNFSFLDGGSYEALTIADGESERKFSILNETVESAKKKSIPVLPYGGFTIQCKKK